MVASRAVNSATVSLRVCGCKASYLPGGSPVDSFGALFHARSTIINAGSAIATAA